MSTKKASVSSIPFVWSKNVDLENLKECLVQLIDDQTVFESHGYYRDVDFLKKRKEIILHIQELCKTFNFKNETCFKTIQIFDMYVCRGGKRTTEEFLNSDINLTVVICLNIACKLEEINCNYIAFLKKNLLDEKSEKNYSLKELSQKETEILKEINFKLSTPTFYHFNNLFLQFILPELISHYTNCSSKNYIPNFNHYMTQLLKLNDYITKLYSTLNESFVNSPVCSGLICFKASLLCFNYLFGVDVLFLDAYFLDKMQNLLSEVINIEYVNNFVLEFFVYTVKN
jgi:hypothetical protein